MERGREKARLAEIQRVADERKAEKSEIRGMGEEDTRLIDIKKEYRRKRDRAIAEIIKREYNIQYDIVMNKLTEPSVLNELTRWLVSVPKLYGVRDIIDTSLVRGYSIVGDPYEAGKYLQRLADELRIETKKRDEIIEDDLDKAFDKVKEEYKGKIPEDEFY